MREQHILAAELISQVRGGSRDMVVSARSSDGIEAVAIVVTHPGTAEYLLGVLELAAERAFDHVSFGIPGRG